MSVTLKLSKICMTETSTELYLVVENTKMEGYFVVRDTKSHWSFNATIRTKIQLFFLFLHCNQCQQDRTGLKCQVFGFTFYICCYLFFLLTNLGKMIWKKKRKKDLMRGLLYVEWWCVWCIPVMFWPSLDPSYIIH